MHIALLRCYKTASHATQVHPTAFLPSASSGDPYNRNNGVRLNYTDREEPCYTGNFHEGQNMACWVEDGVAYLHCYSSQCSNACPYPLGPLEARDTDQVSGALNLHIFVLFPREANLLG